jgi:kumamolisin
MGDIKIPAKLQPVVEGVFGLDDRPQARPMFTVAKTDGLHLQPHATGTSYNPNELQNVQLSKGVDGAGQAIALIELGGGYRNVDMKNYFQNLVCHYPLSNQFRWTEA